eukprot:78025_1
MLQLLIIPCLKESSLRSSKIMIVRMNLVNPPIITPTEDRSSHRIRMWIWRLTLLFVLMLIVDCMNRTIDHSIKAILRMSYNQNGISLLMWNFTLFVSKEFAVIDCLEQAVRSGPRNHINGDSKDSLNIVNIPEKHRIVSDNKRSDVRSIQQEAQSDFDDIMYWKKANITDGIVTNVNLYFRRQRHLRQQKVNANLRQSNRIKTTKFTESTTPSPCVKDIISHSLEDLCIIHELMSSYKHPSGVQMWNCGAQ